MFENSTIRTVLMVFAVIGLAALIFVSLLGVPVVHALVSDSLGFTEELNRVKQAAANRESELLTEVSNRDGTIASKDSIIKSKDATIGEKEADIKRLSEELASVGGSSDDLRKRIDEQLAQINNLNSDLSSCQFDVSQFQNANEELRNTINVKNYQIAILEGLVDPSPDGPIVDPTVTDPDTPVVFVDEFQSLNTSKWAIAGKWAALNGSLFVDDRGSSDRFALIQRSNDWTNYAIQTTLKDIDTNNARFGVVYRASDLNNLAMLYYFDGKICMYKRRSGNFQACDQRDFQFMSGSVLRVEVVGNKAIALVNGFKVAELEGGFPSAGMPGIYVRYSGQGLSFDNFIVELIDEFSQ